MRLRMDPWSRVTGVPGSLYRALPGEDEGAPEDEEPRPRRRGPRERVTRRFRRVFLAWLGGLLLFFTAVNLLVCWRAGKQKAYDLGFPGLNALIALNVSLPLALLCARIRCWKKCKPPRPTVDVDAVVREQFSW